MAWRSLVLVLLAALGGAWAPRAFAAPPAALPPAPASQGVAHVTTVQMRVTPIAGYAAPPPQADPAALAGGWTPVTLPHATKDRHLPRRQIVEAWYRASLSLPASGQATYLYLPRWRAIGHAAIYADGRLVWAPQGSAKWNGFNLPVWVELAGPASPPPKQVLVRLQAEAGNGYDLSTFWVGPKDALAPRYEMRRLLQVTAPEWGCVTFTLIGLVTLGLWLRRRQEPAYLLIFAVAALAGLHSLEYFVGAGPIPISDNAFQWMESNSETWYDALTFVMVSYYIGGATAWMRRLVLAFAVGFTAWTTGLVAFAIRLQDHLGLIWLLNISLNLLTIAVAWWGYRQSPTRIGFLYCLFISLALPIALIDIAISAFKLSDEGVYAVPYMPALQAMLFLYILVDRHLAALGEAEAARGQLASRLAEREAELAVTYDRLRESEQQQMLARERQRLMRDMHDGVGSSLIGALVAVERGGAAPEQTAEILRRCLDDLKLAIDSLEPVDSDLLLLLATARYRLEPRFEQAGIRLVWSVGQLPPLPKITPEHALHILRIVQEIFTNIVKHAQAREVRLSVSASGPQVAIEIVDDGVGFDVAAATAPSGEGPQRRGLANLAARAAAIGGVIAWTSAPGRTRVALTMPLAAA
ncbi:sensor histidine kinase [Caulobacter sp. KR2-114]|uniref:sensor histidine kinase n=1 Tax=Caulobacter sp. KR2-114 TaxID=3400912 RepID=UPI003C0F9123